MLLYYFVTILPFKYEIFSIVFEYFRLIWFIWFTFLGSMFSKILYKIYNVNLFMISGTQVLIQKKNLPLKLTI